MYNLRNRRKTNLTATSRPIKRTKNQKKPRIIPSEVLMEIIKRLPAKKLMQFRCVSKTWNLIIRDPFFAQLHRRFSETRPFGTTTILMCCIRHSRKLCFYKINPHRQAIHELTIDNKCFESMNTFVTEIVNGLVCLWRLRYVAVCNVTTHEIISLPPQLPSCIDLYTIYSLGYDPVNKRYKVLCIRSCPGLCLCMVFTIGESTKWREVIHQNLHHEYVPQVSDSVLYRDVVYNSGSLYWLTRPYHGQKVISFDVVKETFLVIDLPAVLVKEIGIKLVRIGGDIFVFSCDSNLFMIKNFKNHVWVERNIKVPSWICPIGSTGNRLIYRRTCGNTCEFDPDNGEVSDFVVSGQGDDVEQRFIGSLLYPAKYSICETVENIYPLRQAFQCCRSQIVPRDLGLYGNVSIHLPS